MGYGSSSRRSGRSRGRSSRSRGRSSGRSSRGRSIILNNQVEIPLNMGSKDSLMCSHSEDLEQCSIALFQPEIRNNIDALTILLPRWCRKSKGPPEHMLRCRFLGWNCQTHTDRGQSRHQHRRSIGGTHHLLNQYVVPPRFGAALCRGAHDKFIRKRCHRGHLRC